MRVLGAMELPAGPGGGMGTPGGTWGERGAEGSRVRSAEVCRGRGFLVLGQEEEVAVT